ncbi:uncharacterized protein LTR77_001671 [Saxophila tyrrhenica]|uniref:Isochorismatase-like domain-containing protein n=1 Tax=Saxophila tyrrhenica TaxID=1690608 RepID=A0AAV9PLQ9_9PEZI|nr:hypothetical protein LTR77_001671 [Saxophila tyrrhenica]
MASDGNTKDHHKAVIGSNKSFWLFDTKDGFDLTHPSSPDSPPISPRVTIETKTSQISIDPAKSALIVIDMQNYFLSSALGRAKGAGHAAVNQLVEHAVPACRKAGVRIIWLNWGLSQQEIDEMPPAIIRAFGFVSTNHGEEIALDKHGNPRYTGGDKQFEDGKNGKKYSGVGSDMGNVTDPKSGQAIEAGKMLMRDQWNSALYPPLDEMYEEGQKLDERPDVWIHKNRMSGMWGPSTACEEFLEKEGIKTLMFTGVNTDQCVGGTYQDCFSKGYDCVLLSDGCGTTSPAYAQQNMEFNAANTWGFVTTCKALADATTLSTMATPQKRSAADVEAIDLTEGDDVPTPTRVETPAKRARVAQSTLTTTPASNRAILPTPAPAPSATPQRNPQGTTQSTPQGTPQQPQTPASSKKQPPNLYDIPAAVIPEDLEPAERYTPRKVKAADTNTDTDITFSNPQTFCLKPAFWRRWKPKHYALLAECLRQQFDPTHFARVTGLPVEEITHVFSAVVADPLYDGEEACKRGEEGMTALFELAREFGAVNRERGVRKGMKVGEGVVGELEGVGEGKVRVIVEKSGGGGKVLGVGELGEGDVRYLGQKLTKEDRGTVFGEV